MIPSLSLSLSLSPLALVRLSPNHDETKCGASEVEKQKQTNYSVTYIKYIAH
jgi:hypothetical protein